MARLLLLLIFAAGVFFVVRWIMLQPARVRWQVFAVGLALLLLVLVATGRAHWITALFAALLPFVRGAINLLGKWAMLRRAFGGIGGGQQAPSSGQASTVQSRFIRMTLNHDSGEINGEVLAGQFVGKTLDQLDLEALLQLLDECQDDEESVALLQAYLDRVYADEWQDHADARTRQQSTVEPGSMSRQEALQILGLADNPSEDDIITAHRRLMQKMHPDRGGSAYLAAKINLAKDTLLGR